MRGLGRFYQVTVTCAGEADAVTGYFLNIKQIDAAVRAQVLPHLAEVIERDGGMRLGEVMQQMLQRLQPGLGDTVETVRLELTPFYSLSIGSEDMDHVVLRQQFEFAAAHRLHVETLSDEQNREVFGKCNNPSGHGHNYRLEVTVRVPIDEAGNVMAVEQLDQVVNERVIERLDHKHLNLDVPQFQDRNPSVENIAKVIWGMLEPASLDVEEVSVWETGKTVCTYRDPGA